MNAYWFSNWFVDVSKYLPPAIFCVLMIQAFQIDAMINYDNYGAMWIFFLLYGWAIIPFTYLWSFLFKSPGNAMLVTFFINLLFGSIFSIVVYVLGLINSTK